MRARLQANGKALHVRRIGLTLLAGTLPNCHPSMQHRHAVSLPVAPFLCPRLAKCGWGFTKYA
eukprot:1273495-Prorocentrum_lima.AAC.1